MYGFGLKHDKVFVGLLALNGDTMRYYCGWPFLRLGRVGFLFCPSFVDNVGFEGAQCLSTATANYKVQLLKANILPLIDIKVHIPILQLGWP